MNKTIIYLFIATGLLVSCDDTLDPEVILTLTEEQVIKTYNNTEARCTALYTFLPNGLDAVDGAMMAAASDEAEFTREMSAVQKFNTGAWNAIDNPDNKWGHYFRAIRLSNLFLAKSDSVNLDFYRLDPAQQDQYEYRVANIRRWKYEARYLRAYFYFELVKRYAGVPILENYLDIDDDFSAVGRNTLEECVGFIVAECDSAARELPATYDDSQYGRATRGAAMALKSRTLLYAASELFNDASWAGGYAHPELVSLGGDRRQRWIDAAEAAHDLIEFGEGGYGLSDDYQGLFRSYNDREIILARRDGNSNWFERRNYPVGYEGESGNTPSQNLVDAYQMADGSDFDWATAAHAAAPYTDRDPRLGYTVLVNNRRFKDRDTEVWSGGRDGRGVTNATRTGYYLLKYVDPDLDIVQDYSSVHSWIIFRYGEILLNYAEAMNEAFGPDDNNGWTMTAREAVDAVRSRNGVGMPPVAASTREEMRGAIRRERQVELAFEDHRFWDVRRWMTAPQTLGVPLRGVNITKRGGTYDYTVTEVEDRVFSEKMYFYPIPQKELNIVGTWAQNPLW